MLRLTTLAVEEIHTEPDNPKPPNKSNILFLLLIGIGAILVFNGYKGVNFIEQDENGVFRLSEEREQKLQKRLEELDEAEQYVLRADKTAYYPCYNCVNKDSIFLLMGEVWKYGVTTKGQGGRYTDNYLRKRGLMYYIQFKGELGECYKEEQRKIIRYPLLPENLKRNPPIIRPPGNAQDR